jgi:very-short-patch-repair endonuclease
MNTQSEKSFKRDKNIEERLVNKFLSGIMNFPFEFEILDEPKKIWISNKSSEYNNNGFYYNPRLGTIWTTPIVVITPKSSIDEWLSCEFSDEFLVNDLSNRGFGVSEKNLHYFQGMNGVTSNYLREMFAHKIYPSRFNPDFKFDYNEEQSQFLFKLNEYVKNISKGIFINSYVSADPHCGKKININYIVSRFKQQEINKVKEILQQKYPKIEFSFLRSKQDSENIMDLKWSDTDPKNWDKERKEVERKRNEEFRISSFNNFESNAIEKFGDIYNYNLDKFVDLKTPTKVHCKKHNLDFDVVPFEHLKGKRCPKDIESSGENMVRVFLESKKIPYLQYHKMKGCFSEKNGRCYLLTFDFYVPSKNIVIEYDGGQHFGPVSIFGGEESYQRTIMLDAIKNEFCKDNKIKMLRIPYTKTTEEAHEMMRKFLGIN